MTGHLSWSRKSGQADLLRSEICRSVLGSLFFARLRTLKGCLPTDQEQRTKNQGQSTIHLRAEMAFCYTFRHASESEIEPRISRTDSDELRHRSEAQFEKSNRAHRRSGQ